MSGGYGGSPYTWSTKTYWEHQGSGYYDTCFGDRGLGTTLYGGDEVYIHYYLKFSSNWTFPTGGSGIKSFLIGGVVGGGWGHTVNVLIEKWAQHRPFFDVYNDPDANNWGGIPCNDPPYYGSTAAWLTFQWQINQWYEVEAYAKLNTGSNENGIVRLWIDGILLVECTHVRIGTNPYFDHIEITNYISGSQSGYDPNGTQIYTDELIIQDEPFGGSPLRTLFRP